VQGVNQKTAGGWVFSHREMALNWPFKSSANITCHIFSAPADHLCLSPMQHVAAANEVAAATRAETLAGTGKVPGERGSGWTVRVRPRVGPLAAAGAGRWGQLACVSRARVLTQARETRAALRAPARRRAVP